jgi:XTP/dITP diphosphohydrolase
VTVPLAVVLATRNQGKVQEFTRLLGDAFRLGPVPDAVTLPEEMGRTFAENARLKAVGVFAALEGLHAVLADDSGLEVVALAGRPGVLSARYAGAQARDDENVRKLLGELRGQVAREARFVCALCLALPGRGPGFEMAPRLIEVRGVVKGTIAEAARGADGFGYDPVFRPVGSEETLAEVSAEAKDQVSHRGVAVKALLACLRAEGWWSHEY